MSIVGYLILGFICSVCIYTLTRLIKFILNAIIMKSRNSQQRKADMQTRYNKKNEGNKKISSIISSVFSGFIIPLVITLIPTQLNIIPTTEKLTLPHEIEIQAPFNKINVYYTTDGTNPLKTGIKYENRFEVTEKDIKDGEITITAQMKFFSFPIGEMEKKHYKIDGNTVIGESSEKPKETNSTTSNGYSKFEILENGEIVIEDNAKILLKSDQAYYLSADANNGVVFANLKTPSIENAWIINNTNDGYVGFYSSNYHKYLTCEKEFDDKIIRFSSDVIQSWECYKLYVNENFVIIKSQANDMYLACTIDKPDYPVRADATVAQAWEQFSLFLYDEDKMEWVNPITGDYGLQ